VKTGLELAEKHATYVTTTTALHSFNV